MRGFHRSVWGMFVAILLSLATACGQGVPSAGSSTPSVGESFLAVSSDPDDGSETNMERPDVATFAITQSQIVPNVRIARYDEQSVINVYSSVNDPEPAYSGYPVMEDGRFGVWRQEGDRHELFLINGSNGQKTQLLQSTDIESISFYQDQQLFIVNSDYCSIILASGEVRRVGKGRCFGSAIGLRLILETSSGVAISVIDRDLTLVNERKFPLTNARLSALGSVIFGTSSPNSGLTVFDTVDGRKLWKSVASDFNVDVISEARSADSILVAQDSDDNDNLVEILSIRRAADQAVVKTLITARSVSAQLSSDGRTAVIATRQTSNSPFDYQTVDLESGRTVPIDFSGDPTDMAFSRTDYYAYTMDGTLFIGRFGEVPQRAIDVFGNVQRLIELPDSKAFLVVTTDGDQTAMTLIRPTTKDIKADLALTTSGELGFSPSSGSSIRGFLVSSTDTDGYVTLYETRFGSELLPTRIAEGNIRWFSYGPDDSIFYGDVLGGQGSTYSVSKGKDRTRTLVSTRFAVFRQGAPYIRDTSSGFVGTMQAFVDPTLDLCKKLKRKITQLSEGSTEFDLASVEDQIPTEFCIQVPLALRNKDFGFKINPNPLAADDEASDSALEILTGETGAVDPVGSADLLKVVGNADDKYDRANARLEYAPEIPTITLSNPTYLIRGYSWSKAQKATLEIKDAFESNGQFVEFSRSSWTNHGRIQKSCNSLQKIAYSAFSGGAETEIPISVDQNRDAEIVEFCLQIVASKSGEPANYRMVLMPIDISGKPAKLVTGCEGLRGRQSDAANPYGSLSEVRDIFSFASRIEEPSGNYGNITEIQFSLSKGTFGPCFMTHQAPRPLDAGDGERARIRVYLDGTD